MVGLLQQLQCLSLADTVVEHAIYCCTRLFSTYLIVWSSNHTMIIHYMLCIDTETNYTVDY